MASILRVRDSKGKIIEIPAIQGPVGPAGKSAYEYAKESGFEGTEELFAERLLSALEPEPESVFDVEIEVSSEDWKEDTEYGGFVQTVTGQGIFGSDNPIADVLLGSDIEANAIMLDAWACVTRIETSDTSGGTVTLYADQSKPNSAFTMRLKVVR